MMNISFRIGKNYALDCSMLYKYRDWSDGVDFVNGEIKWDCYVGDHNPKFTYWFSFFNICLIDVCIYNVHHTEVNDNNEPIRHPDPKS